MKRGNVIELFDLRLGHFVTAVFTELDSHGNIRGDLLRPNGTIVCDQLSREHKPVAVIARDNEEVVIVAPSVREVNWKTGGN